MAQSLSLWHGELRAISQGCPEKEIGPRPSHGRSGKTARAKKIEKTRHQGLRGGGGPWLRRAPARLIIAWLASSHWAESRVAGATFGLARRFPITQAESVFRLSALAIAAV
jgi:hypothetical protein